MAWAAWPVLPPRKLKAPEAGLRLQQGWDVRAWVFIGFLI